MHNYGSFFLFLNRKEFLPMPELKQIFKKFKPNSEFTITFIVFGYLMVIYTILRLFFFIINHDFFTDVNSSEILRAFIVGLRFDISAIIILNLPLLILFNLPANITIYKSYKAFLLILFCLLNLIGITLNIADFGYYPTIQRRLMYEPYTAVADTIQMLPGLFINYMGLMLGFIISSGLFVFISYKFLSKLIGYSKSKFSFVKSALFFVVLILLAIIGIRGGLQVKPIRNNNAFISDNRPLGYLVLNSTYTVLNSYFQYTLEDYNFMKNEEAFLIARQMVKAGNEEMLDSKFPFLRKRTGNGSGNKKNVVLFIMESWSAQFIGSISKTKTVTPFFDELAKQGILFNNFFASGQRSIEAVPSILASMPAIFQKSIIGSRSEMIKIRGLGSILNEHGYKTSFHHGAEYGSMGFDAFLKSIGFTDYYSKDEFDNYESKFDDGSWGIYDEPFFLDAAKKINGFNKPFCSVIFSLSSHDPYKLPQDKKALFNEFKDDTPFQKSMRYADYSLKTFFEYAKKQNWFNNTIFIITADHTLYTARNDIYSSFNVPLLIYSPQNLQPKLIEQVGTHIDILPTILDLLNISTVHSSMGRSLFDSNTKGFGIMTFFPTFLMFSDTNIYVDDFDKKREFYIDFRSTKAENNELGKHIDRENEMNKLLRAFIQSATYAINKDFLYK